MEQAEKILDAIIDHANEFCPNCKGLMEKIFQK